ncbi:MAG: succinylglutamate desuccinylase [bacterium]
MTNNKSIKIIKIICLSLAVLSIIITGWMFYQHRNYEEKVVLGPGVTDVYKLGEYFEPIKGTVNDSNIYELDSGEPGATVMVIGRAHPEEPATNLTAQLLVENAQPETGRLLVVISASRSASTGTRPGEGYPLYYNIETEWGSKKYRMGDRWANPLDSWPDPEVYVHYPSGQMLSYTDIRNQNRTWPGKADGKITEQTNYAFTNLIEEEEVDLFVDLHTAELEYSVNNCIVTHEEGQDISSMAAMTLTQDLFEYPIGVEFSPPSLHGLSHREVGDHTDAISILFESPTPILDRVRGITGEELLLEGNDPFVRRAGEVGLLYVPMPEEGWPMQVRVGRHLSTLDEVFKQWNMIYDPNPIQVSNIPSYNEVKENGIGNYFKNPADYNEERITYE